MITLPQPDDTSRTAALTSAGRTFHVEIEGLKALAAIIDGRLSDAFARTVQLIRDREDRHGRIVVTGMGKSGHVGTKLAATLASTGTPSFFVHPAEASHGDLGMILEHDIVLALSWSGETAELRNLVDYTRRFRVPLIAVTSNPDSTLAKAGDIVFDLPKVEEACPHGLAPTTSTVMQLALGDALAVALLESRGFSAHDFKVFHPGGQLGANLKFVRDIMHEGDALPSVPRGTGMGEAILAMSGKGFGCALIVEADGTLAGIVTDGDIRRHLGSDLMAQTVDVVMTPGPRTISPDDLASKAMEMMNAAKITTLAVARDGKLVGLVHMHDLLRIGIA